MLEALPSPALAPPSPFELEPPSGKLAAAEADVAQTALVEGATKAIQALHLEQSEGTPVASPASSPDAEGSPMPTLENMRAAWDARERTSIAVGVAGLLAPSISRRREV